MKEKKYEKLIEEAKRAAENHYAPYSKFIVGSAVLGKSGKIYHGANIENASYGLTNCAERTALFNAAASGEKGIEAIAVWTPEGGVFPCGACRQVMFELAADADIVVNGRDGDIIILSIEDLLPFSFSRKDLKK